MSEAKKDDAGEIMRAGFEEFGQYVNPLVWQRARLTGEPVRVVRTEGGRLVDAAGKVYEDFQGTQALGHRPAAVVRAMCEFLEGDAPAWYPSRVSPHAGRLARRLGERTGYGNVFLTCTGSDAVEAAMKLARAATGRPRLLGLEGAYHGCNLGATALMPAGPFRDPFGPHLPGVESLPPGDAGALERALAPGDVAAVLVEPILGEGGVRPLGPDYVAALGELTARHGALLIADEAQTGLGRCGRFLLSEAWPRRPDAVVLAKALGGGMVPVSAMLTSRELFERAYGQDLEDGEAHNTTFACNSVGAVAALAALDLVTGPLMTRVAEVGDWFQGALREALAGLPLFREVRGQGLMVGLELRPPEHPWLSFEHFGLPALAGKGRSPSGPLLCLRLYRHGFHCFPAGHDWGVVRLLPRLDVEREVLETFVAACRRELEALCELS